jgi:Zn-dependent protease
MKDSLRLGRIAGVNVGLHWSLLVIGSLIAAGLAGGRLPLAAPGYSTAEYAVAGGIGAVVFLASVLAHELSHAVVARREGIGVDGITLWLLGGVTRMSSEATTPKAELAVAGVGPLTSFLLGLVMIGLGVGLRAGAISPLLIAVLTWLGVINLILAAFNVLPGAPLDGGRLLYAFVWSRHGDRRQATRVASRAGEILGTVLIAVGLIEFAFGVALGGGLWLALLGWYLRTGARIEETRAEEHYALEGYTVADVMTRNPLVLPASLDVGNFVDSHPMRLGEEFAVQDRDGALVGIVSAKQLRLAARAQRRATRVGDLVQPLSGLQTFRPVEPAISLLERGQEDGHGLALVLDADHLIGTVSQHDLANVVARNGMTKSRLFGAEP